MKNFIRKLIPEFFISWYHFKWAFWGALLYSFPSRKLKIIGITGTNGKSTVVNLVTRILEQAGFRVASLSSIKFKIGEEEWPNTLKMTMPGRFKLQKFLRQAAKAKCQYAVLEITSEGIKQHRHRFINFNIAVFTNLTPEHIESHGSFEKYRAAKAKLFKSLKPFPLSTPPSLREGGEKGGGKTISIVNLDDKSAEYFLQFPADKKWGYTLKSQIPNPKSQINSKIQISNIKLFPNGSGFEVDGEKFKIPLLGKFNVQNAAAAICVGISQGVSLETCKNALEKIEGIPGRMERVVKEPFTVIVDYAHTPDSLKKVYETVGSTKSQAPNNKQTLNSNDQNSKLICVLGAAGGGRDKWKRPELGKIAGQYCDEIILTNEDPYDESPDKIIEEIEKGILSYELRVTSYEKVLDRRQAIKKALESAKPGDTVVITGKGCEPWMCMAKGKKVAWDDRKIVREALRRLGYYKH